MIQNAHQKQKLMLNCLNVLPTAFTLFFQAGMDSKVTSVLESDLCNVLMQNYTYPINETYNNSNNNNNKTTVNNM